MKPKNNIKKAIFALLIGGALFAFSSFTLFQTPERNQEDAAQAFAYRSMANTAFNLGEKLDFRVHYGIINAAKITVKVDPKYVEVKGRSTYHVTAEGRTVKAFDWMYKVRDKFESFVDKEALAPLKYRKEVRENKYRDKDYAVYKPGLKKIFSSKKNIPMKNEYTYDIASALLYARNIDFSKAKKGDTYPIDIYLDSEIYSLSFRYAGKETIKSDVGKVRCIKLIPKLVVDRVFKGEEDMTVWISDDANKIPIRIESKIQVGSLKVSLTKYSGLRNKFTAKVK